MLELIDYRLQNGRSLMSEIKNYPHPVNIKEIILEHRDGSRWFLDLLFADATLGPHLHLFAFYRGGMSIIWGYPNKTRLDLSFEPLFDKVSVRLVLYSKPEHGSFFSEFCTWIRILRVQIELPPLIVVPCCAELIALHLSTTKKWSRCHLD